MKKISQYLLPFDWLIIFYSIFCAIYILLFSEINYTALNHIYIRVIILIVISTIIAVNFKVQSPITRFIRYLYPLATLIYFYPEIDFFDGFLFESFDSMLVNIEEILFHTQPSILFYEKVPFPWFNEIMFASYFSFYPLILFVSIYLYIKDIRLFNEVFFVIIFSFVIYYLVFIFFPAGGPQYYFNFADIEIPVHGIFGKMMRLIQELGERPAAAFPSSHVGVAVIVVIYVWNHLRRLLPYMIVIVFLLFISTVYIRAHYLIDSIAGLITAPILYLAGKKLYSLMKTSDVFKTSDV